MFQTVHASGAAREQLRRSNFPGTQLGSFHQAIRTAAGTDTGRVQLPG